MLIGCIVLKHETELVLYVFSKILILLIFIFVDGHIHSMTGADDSNIVGFLHRVIDLEEADRETMHLLVFLLMQFLSRSEQVVYTCYQLKCYLVNNM